jgi:hypothetical protein
VDASSRVAVAAVFVWVGMVLAISFLEGPLKFRAPAVTLRIGLGIGRLIFRALNTFELFFAIVVTVALFDERTPATVDVPLAVAVTALLFQLLLVRPLLAHRTIEVLVGDEGTRSRAHYTYVALELVKVIALVITGVSLLGT